MNWKLARAGAGTTAARFASDSEDIGISPARAAWLRVKQHRGLHVGFGIMFFISACALLAPLVAPSDPYVQSLTERLLPPVWVHGGVWAHPLGTDMLGRDYLSRILYGARISMMIGLGAASIGCLIGVTLGVTAGYFGGRYDQAVNFLLSCHLALPGLLIIMALVFLIGSSIKVVIVVIGVNHWAFYLLVTRSATMRIKQLDFIAAARAAGSSRLQILCQDVLPNVFNQIIVVFTLEVGIAILSEAALSFLGMGVPSPMPSWGLMIAEGKQAMFFQPWLVILPGIMLFSLVIAINLMGDGIRDVTAPEHRN